MVPWQDIKDNVTPILMSRALDVRLLVIAPTSQTYLHDEHGLVRVVSDHVVVELNNRAAFALPEDALDLRRVVDLELGLQSG